MKSPSNNWNPCNNFLNSGKALFFCQIEKKEFEIQWEFTIFNSKSPFSLVKCEIQGFSINAQGFGDDISVNVAFKKALAEAWERLWMFRLSILKSNNYPNIKNSNGFASGRTVEEAINSSKNELIERKLFMASWEDFGSWTPHKLKHLYSKLLSTFFKKNGFELHFYKINNNLGEFIVGCSRKKGLYFDSIFFDEKDYKESERKLLGSLMRSFWKEEIFSQDSSVDIDTLKNSSDMSDHIRFYLNPNNHSVLNDIRHGARSGNKVMISDIEKINTIVITKTSAFPAVAYSFNPCWQNISWGKDYFENRSVQWPHPLD